MTFDMMTLLMKQGAGHLAERVIGIIFSSSEQLKLTKLPIGDPMLHN